MSVSWTFFLGVHCTITSSLVKICEQERGILNGFGTVVLAPPGSKQLHSKEVMDVIGRSGQKPLSLPDLILGANSDISKGEETEKVLFINESFLGSTRTNTKTGLLYPKLKKSIKEIPEFFDNPWHTICFCVLPYHEFFESCYLDSPGVSAGIDLSGFKEKVFRFERTWVDIIEEIAERLPNIGIRIWRLDDTRKLRSSIEKNLFNASGGFLPTTIDVGSPFVNKKRQSSRSIWTSEEVERSNVQFETDWYHLKNGWPDYIVK